MTSKKPTSSRLTVHVKASKLVPSGEVTLTSAKILQRNLKKKDGTEYKRFRLSGVKSDGKKFSLILGQERLKEYKAKGITVHIDTSKLVIKPRKPRKCKGGNSEKGCKEGYRVSISRA